MSELLGTQYRIDFIPSDLALFNAAIIARKFPATRSDIKVGSNTMTLFAGLSKEKVIAAFPCNLPKESEFSAIVIDDNMQESLA